MTPVSWSIPADIGAYKLLRQEIYGASASTEINAAMVAYLQNEVAGFNQQFLDKPDCGVNMHEFGPPLPIARSPDSQSCEASNAVSLLSKWLKGEGLFAS